MTVRDAIEHAALSPPVVGNCRYETTSGWHFDPGLLRLWGVTASDAPSVLIDPLLPVTLQSGARTWDAVVAALGPEPCVVLYRLVDTDHARVRELQAVLRWGQDGSPDPAVHASHMDITSSVATTRVQERARAAATTDRLLALSRMGAAVASGTPPSELLHRITRLASACIGGCAHLIVVDRRRTAYEWDIVAPDLDRQQANAERGESPATGEMTIPAQGPAAHRRAVGGDRERTAEDRGPMIETWEDLVICARKGALNKPEGQRVVRATLGEPHISHHLAVELKTAGRMIGLLAISRDDRTDPFDPADQGLLQVLADGAGVAVAQARARGLLDRRTRQLRDVNEQREELLGQRDGLIEQLDSAESRERMLVAEAVHDDPLQLIVAASLRLDTMPKHPDAQAEQEIERSIELLEQASDRLRSLMTIGIAPPDLSGGLWPAVRAVATAIFLGSATTVTVTGPDAPVDPTAESAAYRVIREALINARKHAHAATVTVRGTQHANTLRVVVEDDGVGCDRQSSPEGHFGISVMNARAAAAGGSVILRRRDGGGCEVGLELPEAFPADHHAPRMPVPDVV